jgi:hypothetical protein
MFAQALANRLACGGVHLAATLPMIALLPVAGLVVLFLVDKLEDVGLAGFACAAVAVWLTDRTQGARERLVEARA